MHPISPVPMIDKARKRRDTSDDAYRGPMYDIHSHKELLRIAAAVNALGGLIFISLNSPTVQTHI